MEDELRLQSRATEKYYDQIFEEKKELEEKKSEEALLVVQKTYGLWRYPNERDEARRPQRSGNSRRMKKEMDFQHSFGGSSSKRSRLESPRERQDVQEVMDEDCSGRRREEEEKMHGGWNQKGKRRCRRPESYRTGLEGVYVDLDGECHHERGQIKKTRRQIDTPGEEGEEIKSPKRRKIIQVES